MSRAARTKMTSCAPWKPIARTSIVLAENIVSQEAAKTVLRLRARNCSMAIILLLEERDAITAAGLLDLDVEGILLSAACARSVIDCVESVRHGRKWVDPNLLRHLAMADRPSQIASSLTSREAEIARLVSRGLRNKEIARELHLSEGTVKMHLHHIYEKLHLGGRTQLALSTAGACAPMPVSGNGVRPPEEPAGPDSAERPARPDWPVAQQFNGTGTLVSAKCRCRPSL